MKLLAFLCLAGATYLWFPLPMAKRYRRKSETETLQIDPKSHSESRVASSSEVLQALKVIQLSISSGMTISGAIEFAQDRIPVVAARELELVLNHFRLGLPLSSGLEEIATKNHRWRAISDTLTTALNSGSPVGDHLKDVEFVSQSAIDTEKLKRIKSVAVKSVLPLGLCFLPAFILLAVIPIIAGLLKGFSS